MTGGREPASNLSVFLWFFQVATVWMSIAFLIWISLTPKSPVYMITDVRIPAMHKPNSTLIQRDKLAVRSSFVHEAEKRNPTIAVIRSRNTSIFLNMEISNPNERMGIHFDDIYMTFYHNHTIVGSESYPGFYQGYKRATLFHVRVKIHQRLLRLVRSSRSMDVRVCLGTSVQYKILGYKTKHQRMDLEAYIHIDSNGKKSREKNIELHQMKQIKHGS